MNTWKYFSDEEVAGLDPELVSKLDSARHVAGIPFTITSGKRSPEENEKAMGVDGSAHVRGLGVDLRIKDSYERYLMVNALLSAGFKRLGVYDKHIHADIAQDLPTPRIWIGVSH